MSVGAVNKSTGDRIPTAGMPAIDDALDLTSVNPVQNAIITAALANKQDKTDNSLQTTDKTVVGAVNELKSGLINMVLLASGASASITVSETNVLRKYKEFFFLIEGTIENSQNTIITSCIVPMLAMKTDSWENRFIAFGDIVLYLKVSPRSINDNGFTASINKSQTTDWNYTIKAVYGFN